MVYSVSRGVIAHAVQCKERGDSTWCTVYSVSRGAIHMVYSVSRGVIHVVYSVQCK